MIKLDNVSKTYENGTRAVQNVNLLLDDTGFIAITGTSGCGKSTLINLMTGQDLPTAGEIEWNGKKYSDINGNDLKKDFGYIYQDFKLIDNLTVYQNIMIGHELANDTLDYDFVLETAKQLELAEVLDEKVYSLSGGQQQRVAIARSIVRKPKVIFADEPTGNLDTQNTITVLNILRKLSEDALVVVVSHDKNIINWADRLLTMQDGKIAYDILNESACFASIEESEQTQEEEDIAEILQLQQKKSKKVSKFFASGNKPKRTLKKAGLSAKSSLGLSIALLNKDIVKKVCIVIVMVIFTAIMTLSCAMTFATVEKTMANAINSNDGQKFFTVSPTIYDPTYKISNEDMQRFDKILEDSGLPYMEIGTGEVIANGWSRMKRAGEDKQIAYYSAMNFEDMCNAVFVDNAEAVGFEILLGNEPKYNNEIAISKTYYDYLLYCKEFEVEINGNIHKIIFTKENILGKPIAPFGVTICGVFDDKNNLDENWKNIDLSSVDLDEKSKMAYLVQREMSTNPLINLVIKCAAAKDDYRQFAGINSNTKMTFENCFGIHNRDYYFEFAPLNRAIKNYFDLSDATVQTKLDKNQILIDNAMLKKFNKFFANNQVIADGSKLSMCVVRMTSIAGSGMIYPDLTYSTEEVTVKVVDSLGNASGIIFMSDETYEVMKASDKFSTKRLICDKNISATSLKKLNKGFSVYVKEIFDSHRNHDVSYQIANCPLTQSNDYGVIYICQEYLCIPLMIVSMLATIAMTVLFYFDFVKTKAKDLLVLKSLAAKTSDFVKIYGVFAIVLLAILLVVGLALGSLLIFLINTLVSSLSGYASVFSIFYLDIASVMTVIALTIVVGIVSLAISIASLGDKNLRKAFQKLKK